MHSVGRYGRYRTVHESRDWHQSVCGVARILECRLVREAVGRTLYVSTGFYFDQSGFSSSLHLECSLPQTCPQR